MESTGSRGGWRSGEEVAIGSGRGWREADVDRREAAVDDRNGAKRRQGGGALVSPTKIRMGVERRTT
jgi:hypothetical protein